MKKFLLVISILLALFLCASCASHEEQTETILYDDGSYMVTTLREDGRTYTTVTDKATAEVIPQSNSIQDSYNCLPLSQYVQRGKYPASKQSRYISWVKTDDGNIVLVWCDKYGNVLYNTNFVTKNCSYYSADGRLLWTMSVTALFKKNILDSFCNVVSSNITVWETDSWYVISEDTSEIGETAAYTVQFGRKNLGVTIAEPAYTVNLSRDALGNFS